MKQTEVQQLIQNNKLDAIAKYLYQEAKTVKKYIVTNSGTNDDVKDVMQDALVILVQKISNKDFVLSSDLKTYFVAICKNVWFSELRRQKKDAVEVIESTFDEQEEQRYRLAEKALEGLGEACKKLLNDFYILKLSMEAIAKNMGLKSQAIAKDRKYKCLSQARKMYSTIQTQNH